MPLSEADLIEVQAVARAYSDAEARILMRLTASLAAGLEAPEWETQTLGRLQRLRQAAVNELAAADELAAAMIEGRLNALYMTGGRDVLKDVGERIAPEAVASATMRNAVRRIATELGSSIGEASTAMLRATDDAYRRIVGEVTTRVVARGQSKRDALRDAVQQFFGKGLPAFTDSAGRKWRIQDYANMAVRTGYAAAQIQGHEDALDAAGLDLVIVQPGPRACDICDEWARKVLIRGGGSPGSYWRDNALTGQGMTVKVDDSLDAARAAGFQHPNCRCSIRAFIPGVTKRSDIERPPWDAEGYERQQQQRGLERQVRESKIALATAQASGDPAEIAKAQRRLAARQGALRDHLAANPTLKRRSDREQVLAPRDGGAPATPRTPAPSPAPEADQTAKIARAEAASVARQVERPASEADLMQRFRRLAEPETVADIVTKSNPGGDSRIDRDYLMNCHYVVAAVEMRARGYDVVARPTVKQLGRYNRQIEDDYLGDRTFSYYKDAARDSRGLVVGGNGMLGWIDAETAAMPVGARGYVTGNWARGGGGHIWTWEKTAAGVVYHEGQIKAHDSEKARMNVLALQPNSLSIMRTDDLEPSPSLLGAVQSPDEFALDGEARLRNEIERVQERIDTLEATLVQQIAERDRYATLVDAYREWERLKREAKNRRLPVRERYAAVERANALLKVWSADRDAAQKGVNADQVVRGTREHITKWKTELNRLKRELRAFGG